MDGKRYTMEAVNINVRMAILIWDKIDIKTKNSTRDKVRHFIMIKSSIGRHKHKCMCI